MDIHEYIHYYMHIFNSSVNDLRSSDSARTMALMTREHDSDDQIAP